MLKLDTLKKFTSREKAENAIEYLRKFPAFRRWPLKAIELDEFTFVIQEYQDTGYYYLTMENDIVPCKIGISR